ncbi:hypothetical protein [Rhodocaloribacter sp.]
MPEPPPLPRGLVFFSPHASPKHRQRRIVFVSLVVTALLALIWPVYTLAAGVFPLVLGLPLSLAWVVFWLLVVFAALIRLFRSDH